MTISVIQSALWLPYKSHYKKLRTVLVRVGTVDRGRVWKHWLYFQTFRATCRSLTERKSNVGFVLSKISIAIPRVVESATIPENVALVRAVVEQSARRSALLGKIQLNWVCVIGLSEIIS